MKRILDIAAGTCLLAIVVAGSGPASQELFKMSFKFQAAGKSFAPGEYQVEQKGEGQLVFRRESTGQETAVPFVEKLPAADRPAEGPRLVFAMVGNFEPSYTEYVTEYVLKEVWLDGKSGGLVRAFKGAHQTHVVKAGKAGD